LSVLGKSWKSVRIWIVLDFKDLYSLSVNMQLISKISKISAADGELFFTRCAFGFLDYSPQGWEIYSRRRRNP
jgi:hypothetical protein